MNLYIKKAFINGRRLFGTPLTSNPRGYRTVQVGRREEKWQTEVKQLQDYFFDPDLLTDGAPPNDRGCRACGKVGILTCFNVFKIFIWIDMKITSLSSDRSPGGRLSTKEGSRQSEAARERSKRTTKPGRSEGATEPREPTTEPQWAVKWEEKRSAEPRSGKKLSCKKTMKWKACCFKPHKTFAF